MRKLISLLMALLILPLAACASDPANPADPGMVAALLPGYVYVQGIDDGEELRLLMRTPAGELVFIGGVLNADGTWALTESTPLPEETFLGVENFTHSLGIPTEPYLTLVSMRPYADGTWGVSYLEPSGDKAAFQLGKHHLRADVHEVEGYWGNHPWGDITTIDWASLPGTYDEAIASLDTSRWMIVNNPNPEDRLHLRTKADRNAASLGKYYNRTPVYIRQYGNEWCAVTVCGVDGWMMTQFLAPAADITSIKYAGPWLAVLGEETPLCASADPSSAFSDLHSQDRFFVFGIVGEEWYHIWLPRTEECGYVRQDALWPGNG